ncbi:MAG: hypothetical protein R2854_15350 [Caldilineaceae bacterium]
MTNWQHAADTPLRRQQLGQRLAAGHRAEAVDDPLIERTPTRRSSSTASTATIPPFRGGGRRSAWIISDNDRAGLIFGELTAMTVTRTVR